MRKTIRTTNGLSLVASSGKIYVCLAHDMFIRCELKDAHKRIITSLGGRVYHLSDDQFQTVKSWQKAYEMWTLKQAMKVELAE